MFVLRRGVLQYYKVDPSLDVRGLAEELGGAGGVRVIGPDLVSLQRGGGSATPSGQANHPQGEVHLQVAQVRESRRGDGKRFSIHSGTRKIKCRAESEADRDAWLSTIMQSKERWSSTDGSYLFSVEHTGDSPSSSGQTSRSFEDATLPAVRQHLEGGRMTPELVEEVLMEQHKFYVNYMRKEGENKRRLLSYVKALEVQGLLPTSPLYGNIA
ncbi:unnamed protein product [Ostreobium quekettii]|uniref:PH domain-containing protein n=1 Tax=Ostreobium quekettii TaxID=121088 RepID=A0A8S1J0C2_9CHLO|nr:unnamed protein product [Ostreobium quekettii]